LNDLIQDADDAVRLVRGMLRRGEAGEAFRERKRVSSWNASEAGLVSASFTEESGTAVRLRRGNGHLLVARSGSSPEALRSAVRDAAKRTGNSPFLKPQRAEKAVRVPSAAASSDDDSFAALLQAALAKALSDPRGIALSLTVSRIATERVVITPGSLSWCGVPSRLEVSGTIRRADAERAFSFQSTRPAGPALESLALLLQEALRPVPSTPPPGGETDVVLAPSAAIVFWHETVGHPLEAEAGERASVLSRVRSAAVAPKDVDVADDPLREDLPGAYRFDDEGTAARRVALISSGVVGDLLSDRRTAGPESNGHARTPDFRRRPRPRMANLVVAAGSRREEEMVEACGEGIYVREIASGSADPESGHFALFVERADLIRRGRLGGPVGRFVLTGDVLRALSQIDGPRGDTVLPSAGLSLCVKGGDPVPVGGAAPALLVRALLARPPRR
jgi:predicted Zn-dependent protease